MAGCARRGAAPAGDVFPYRSDEQRVFYATAGGLTEKQEAGEARRASQAHNAAVLSADGECVFVAVNRVGVAFIEASSDGSAYRIATPAAPGTFARLSAGGAWPLEGGFLAQLYRDPFAARSDETESVGDGDGTAGPFLYFFPTSGEARAIPTDDDTGLLAQSFREGYALLALFPQREGTAQRGANEAKGTALRRRWLAELRMEHGDRARMRYLDIDLQGRISATPSTASAAISSDRTLDRRAFEAALAPRPLAMAEGLRGEGLRLATAALAGQDGAVLIRVRSSGGDDEWLAQGPVEEAVTLSAWAEAEGSVLVLGGDGRAATVAAGAGSVVLVAFRAPEPEATFTTVAAADGIAAAAWEAGDFPDIQAAGIVVAAVGSRGDR
jgi:hypothetical protein